MIKLATGFKAKNNTMLTQCLCLNCTVFFKHTFAQFQTKDSENTSVDNIFFLFQLLDSPYFQTKVEGSKSKRIETFL